MTIAWLKMRITIIPISSIGAEDGLRASALIVPCPMTATTTEGPRIAAMMTKMSVAKLTDLKPLTLYSVRIEV